MLSLLDCLIIDFDDMDTKFVQQIRPETKQALQSAIGGERFDLGVLMKSFLEGSGAPCVALLDLVKDRFHPSVSLERISEETYRMRLFALATSGTAQKILDGSTITVCLLFY